ncbi:uncharacterized protein C21orf58 [Plectropomus leopardus]|uniref:uncharacterized protein C21orf58 n=1 Tax=Plectropomus leopardus TaxID=160734 RepID=UPI001C4DD188|nr:uncharacterized protein C21orf58 [Plectropomus leopardus]
MTRLKLKLLEKRLENKEHNMDERAESAQSARSYRYDRGQLDQLHRALRRKQDLLQRLKEQHMLEDLNRPHTWAGSQRQYKSHFPTAPHPPPQLPPHQSAPAPPFVSPPHPPRIIQQTLPQQPATIIQQLPQQQPLITQIPPPQPHPVPRSGSIKEDMVELMLMQNAQMHQIIMHNMMLKAMPSMLPPGGPSVPQTTYLEQDSYPIFLRPDVKPRGRTVHHHHHYGTTPAASQLPPICPPAWLPMVSSVPAGQAAGHLPTINHTTPFTLPPLNT